MKWLALAALLIALPASAQMYKCVDERGVVHYTDKPTAGCKGGLVDIQPIPPLSGQATKPQAPNPAQQDADFNRRQIERERQDSLGKAAQNERCARVRQELAWLSAATRVARINDAGERVYMDDATRDARMAQLKQQIRACP
jgi:Domain of unknown function (DUF4124)